MVSEPEGSGYEAGHIGMVKLDDGRHVCSRVAEGRAMTLEEAVSEAGRDMSGGEE